MVFVSHRRERMGELRRDLSRKHEAAGKLVVFFVRAKTPIGTPASTGDPNYPVTAALWRSIDSHASDDHVDVGTNKKYGAYVHQGTYDYAHGYRGWTEGEAREFNSLTDTRDTPRGTPPKGMKPRPFLVNGLLDAREMLIPLYAKPIN